MERCLWRVKTIEKKTCRLRVPACCFTGYNNRVTGDNAPASWKKYVYVEKEVEI